MQEINTQNAPKKFAGYQADIAKYSTAFVAKFGIGENAALEIARQAAQDVHNGLKTIERTFSVGKVKHSDGTVSLSDGTKAKGIPLTKPISMVKAIDWLGEAEKNFVSFKFTDWKVSRMGDDNSIAAYVEAMEKQFPTPTPQS